MNVANVGVVLFAAIGIGLTISPLVLRLSDLSLYAFDSEDRREYGYTNLWYSGIALSIQFILAIIWAIV
jgi:hypothetical protein